MPRRRSLCSLRTVRRDHSRARDATPPLPKKQGLFGDPELSHARTAQAKTVPWTVFSESADQAPVRRCRSEDEVSFPLQLKRTDGQTLIKKGIIQMGKVIFKLNICGISDNLFADKIMIYQPLSVVQRVYSTEELQSRQIQTVSELINHIKSDESIKTHIDDYSYQQFGIDTVYIFNKRYLFGFRENKEFSYLFDFFRTNTIELHYFICGGASFNNDLHYKFIIHTDEDIHKYKPHVHVKKEGKEVRYSLLDFEPMDELVYPHKRDSRKIIIPYIRKHQKEWLKLWSTYQNGFEIPVITENGNQYYLMS